MVVPLWKDPGVLGDVDNIGMERRKDFGAGTSEMGGTRSKIVVVDEVT